MLAACSTGNSVIILAAVAALLFLLVGDNSNGLLNRSKLDVCGCCARILIVSHSVVKGRLLKYRTPQGAWLCGDYGSGGYGEYGGLAGDDSNSEPDVEKVSESEYKRQEYSMNGMLLGFGVLFWFLVANYAKGINKLEKEKTELEKSWVRIILNPNSVQDIRQHPEAYRDDFKQWIKEIQPDLLLPAKDETQHQP